MKSEFLRKGRLASSSALRAIALVGAGLAAGGIVSAPAHAQDYTAGAVSGTVTDESGNSVQGATVTLTSSAQGFTRTATTSSSGSFRFNNLPTGNYDVVVTGGNLAEYRAEGVSVLAGQTVSLNIAASTANTIVVTGATISRDFEGTTTGLNVNVEDLVKSVPVGRDLTSVVLLAPSTSLGDSAFGNLASVSGSSVAENAYYVNGLNVTNFDNYLGGADVPFEFYRTVEVKAGGYPAEFGRATGGIINTTTKSGSNDFYAAAHINWSPNFLRSNGRNLVTYDSATDSYIPSTDRRLDRAESLSTILEAGGPVIRDRLFVYGLVEMRRNTSREVNTLAGTSYEYISTDPFWGAKIDAYPLDNHHLEFTIFDTERTNERSDVQFTTDSNGQPVFGLADSVTDFNNGGLNYVGRYTGTFTQWFTLSAAYGRYKERFDNSGVAGAAGAPYFLNSSGEEYQGVPFGAFFNGQRVLSQTFPHITEREFYRVDADFFVSLLGDHHIRVGYDQEDNTLTKSSVRTGADALVAAGLLSPDAFNAGAGGAGAALILRAPAVAGGPPVVEVNYFNSGGSFGATNRAFYIQDEWSVTDRLTLNFGLRRDDFKVNRPDGQQIVNLDKNYQPRVGFTYDMFDGSRGRLYGSYGEYNLPFASNTSFRTTGAEFYIRERYEVAGLDSNGLPILGDQVTNNPSYQAACPIDLTPDSSGGFCNVTGDGSIASADTLISRNLKATKQNEFIIGYEQNIGEFQVGINYTRRRLLANAEDVAIDAAVLAYCAQNNIDGCEDTFTGFHQYVILNPGRDAVVQLDGANNEVVTLTAEDLGYPKAKRKYDGVEFTFDRPWDGSYSFGGSYLWSKTRGNSEGFVQSDFGQDDAGLTQDFDQPGFTDFAYGRLPNDRRHRIKLRGAVGLDDSLVLGINAIVESPRPLSCFGFDPRGNFVTPDDPYSAFGNAYGAASRFCGGEPSPRGTAQRSQWTTTFNVKAAYNFEMPTGQAVTLRADVFNLFNSQSITERNEIGELDSPIVGAGGLVTGYDPNPNYGLATRYQTPRYVRLGVDVTF